MTTSYDSPGTSGPENAEIRTQSPGTIALGELVWLVGTAAWWDACMTSTSSSHSPVGIDFGGSGIKGALVDLERGDFDGERKRIPTPEPSTPDAVAAVLVELLRKLGKGGKVVLCGLQPRVKGLLEIARLNTIFAIAATEQEALAL